MKFLQSTLNETLRLYPVVPFNVRFALKDTTLPRGGGPDGLSPVAVLSGTPVLRFPSSVVRHEPQIVVSQLARLLGVARR